MDHHRHCEWGTCDAVATETMHGVTPGNYPRLTTEHYCEDCAPHRRAELQEHFSETQDIDRARTLFEALVSDDVATARDGWRLLTLALNTAHLSLDLVPCHAYLGDILVIWWDDEHDHDAIYLSPAQVLDAADEILNEGGWAVPYDSLTRHGKGPEAFDLEGPIPLGWIRLAPAPGMEWRPLALVAWRACGDLGLSVHLRDGSHVALGGTILKTHSAAVAAAEALYPSLTGVDTCAGRTAVGADTLAAIREELRRIGDAVTAERYPTGAVRLKWVAGDDLLYLDDAKALLTVLRTVAPVKDATYMTLCRTGLEILILREIRVSRETLAAAGKEDGRIAALSARAEEAGVDVLLRGDELLLEGQEAPGEGMQVGYHVCRVIHLLS